jgi:hypothetical protein
MGVTKRQLDDNKGFIFDGNQLNVWSGTHIVFGTTQRFEAWRPLVLKRRLPQRLRRDQALWS